MSIFIRTFWRGDLYAGDWGIDPPGLASGQSLETAVIISLFSDRLASADDVLPAPGDKDRRGWWGDTGAVPRDPIGSRIWLLSREKQTNDVRLRAEEYAREALQWVLDDGVADVIDCTAAWESLGRLILSVNIYRAESLVLAGRYGWAWGERYAV